MPPRKPKTPSPTPTTRQRTPKPDPLHSVKTEVCASLGETWLKVECPLHLAGAVALRLHEELKKVADKDPELGHIERTVHGGMLDVGEPEYEQGKQRKAPHKAPLGFG